MRRGSELRYAAGIFAFVVACVPRSYAVGDSLQSDTLAIAVRDCLASAGYNEVFLDRAAVGLSTVTARLDSSEITFVIDPKAPMTFVDMGIAKELGYELEPTGTDVNFGGQREPLYTITPSVTTIGGLQLDALELKVTRIAHFARAAGIPSGLRVGGIFGEAFLRSCATLIDLDNDRMFLRHPPEPEPLADTTDVDTGEGSQMDKIRRKLREKESEWNRRRRGEDQ